jgi:hypothetical protein
VGVRLYPYYKGTPHLLLDETGRPVLCSGGLHWDRSAGASIMVPDQSWFRFPVRGTRKWNAIMTAVD